LAASAAPVPPPTAPAAAPPGMEHCRLRSKHRFHVAWRRTQPNSQTRSRLAQRTPARSTGGDCPSGTDMKRVAAARTTGCYRNRNPYQVPLNIPAAALSCLVLYAPRAGRTLLARWGGRRRCWPAAPLPPPYVYLGLLVVQAVTRVLRMGPRLVNVVSLRKQSNFLCL
jgi:hypothetical protein